MNQDTIELLKQERTEDVYQEVIGKNIIMELSSETPEKRLLGIHVDLDY